MATQVTITALDNTWLKESHSCVEYRHEVVSLRSVIQLTCHYECCCAEVIDPCFDMDFRT